MFFANVGIFTRSLELHDPNLILRSLGAKEWKEKVMHSAFWQRKATLKTFNLGKVVC